MATVIGMATRLSLMPTNEEGGSRIANRETYPDGNSDWHLDTVSKTLSEWEEWHLIWWLICMLQQVICACYVL